MYYDTWSLATLWLVILRAGLGAWPATLHGVLATNTYIPWRWVRIWSLLFFALFCMCINVSLKAGFQPIIPTSLQQYGFCHFRWSSPHQDSQSACTTSWSPNFTFQLTQLLVTICPITSQMGTYWATVNAGVCQVIAARERNKSQKKIQGFNILITPVLVCPGKKVA